jgi:hypothetical protein
MRKSKTHFEQVPLEVVRRIVQEDARAHQHADMKYPAWQGAYLDTMVELNPERLKERVATVEAVIFLRMQELVHSPDGVAEQQAIEDALSGLRILQRDKLNFPEWEPE